jgi:hypothetical protein
VVWGLINGHHHSLFLGDAKAEELSHSGAGKRGALSTAKKKRKGQKAKGKTKKQKKQKENGPVSRATPR